jgi:hypothetical protein
MIRQRLGIKSHIRSHSNAASGSSAQAETESQAEVGSDDFNIMPED